MISCENAKKVTMFMPCGNAVAGSFVRSERSLPCSAKKACPKA